MKTNIYYLSKMKPGKFEVIVNEFKIYDLNGKPVGAMLCNNGIVFVHDFDFMIQVDLVLRFWRKTEGLEPLKLKVYLKKDEKGYVKGEVISFDK